MIQRCRHLFWKVLHYSINMLHDSQIEDAILSLIVYEG
jgi:hypothetical protein